MNTLAATLEAALTGQASPVDVIAAIDSELAGKVTVLVSKAHKAAYSVQPIMSKLPKPFKDFPVCATLRLETIDGKLHMTGIHWDPKTEGLTTKTEAIPARVESDFAVCVPARAFVDWLRASQLTTHEKKVNASEQIQLTLDGLTLIVTIGNARARFNCLSADEFPAVN